MNWVMNNQCIKENEKATYSVCVCVCEFVSTVNRGHTPTLHIQTEDNSANEEGPQFVDMCKWLQIAYSRI